ncbi:MAG: hypothetical protein EA401_11685 [Planctomycetota bacterium]|nr:MAG: hypothetical protein EA401_11685 [Planctomycetota bacterium]
MPRKKVQTHSVDDAQDLLAVAQRKRAGKQAPAAVQTSRKKAGEREESVSRGDSDPWNAHSGDDDTRRGADWPTFLLTAVAVVVIVLTGMSLRMAPPAAQHTEVLAPDGVPTDLMREWLRGFHDSELLFRRPDAQTLDAFAAYLRNRTAVDEVHSVRLRHHHQAGRHPMKLAIDVTLHRPMLPVMLANGERAWLGERGHILPGILPGPSDRPLVRGIEYADGSIVDEIVAVWPQLHTRLHRTMPGLIREIHAHAPLPNSDDHGVIFTTSPGTVLVWGNPEESRYGVSREQRLSNLIHTLRSQGDLRRVPEINVRFHEPFAVVASQPR